MPLTPRLTTAPYSHLCTGRGRGRQMSRHLRTTGTQVLGRH